MTTKLKSINKIIILLLCIVIFFYGCILKVNDGEFWKLGDSFKFRLYQDKFIIYDLKISSQLDVVDCQEIYHKGGTFKIEDDILLLTDSSSMKDYRLKILNNEMLIVKDSFFNYHYGDTLNQCLKYYKNGKIKWQEFNIKDSNKIIRSYYDGNYHRIRVEWYDLNHKIIKQITEPQ